VVVGFTDDGTGLQLTDAQSPAQFDNDSPSSEFMVVPINGSSAAYDLRIVGVEGRENLNGDTEPDGDPLIDRFDGYGVIEGGALFTLYDTFGIPLDLVEEMAKEKNLTLDRDGFSEHLERQRERSKEKQVFKDDYQGFYEALSQRVSPTAFVGYDTLEDNGKLLAILVKGEEREEAREGEEAEVIVDTTPFYAESGGQVGDTGTVRPLADAE